MKVKQTFPIDDKIVSAPVCAPGITSRSEPQIYLRAHSPLSHVR